MPREVLALFCKPLECVEELEHTVWKMMQEQGRDTYCDRCNRIKKGYLKKCTCGGKYIFKEFPAELGTVYAQGMKNDWKICQ
jgi:hypothetical protein